MKLIHVTILSMSLMFWSTHVLAQEFSFVKFGQQEGLLHSQVVSISQDNTGNLWLGTMTRSIYRFDGKSFQEYKIYTDDPNATIYALRVQADSRGRVWVLSNIGLICFNGRESKVVPHGGNMLMGTLADLFLDGDDNVWVTDHKGDVFTLRNDSLVFRKDIQQALHGVIGHYTSESGVLCFFNSQGKLFSDVKRAEFMPETTPWATKKQVHAIHQISKNAFVVGSSSGVERFSRSGSEVVAIPGMTNRDFISKLTVDERGWIWGIMSGKLFVIDQENAVRWVADSSDLKNDAIFLFQDKDKSIWVSIDVIGIAKYKQHAWNKIPLTAGIDITSMVQIPASRKIVFGTYNHGIIGYDKPILMNTPVASLYYNQAGLFAGTLRRGSFKIDGEGKSVFPSGTPDLDVNGITSFGDSIILATHRGLYIIEGACVKYYAKKVLGYPVSLSCPIVINRSVYVTGMMAGLMKLEGDSLAQVGPEKLNRSTVYVMRQLAPLEYVVTGEFPEVVFLDSTLAYRKSINLSPYLSNILLIEFIDAQHFIVGSNDGLFKVTLKDDSVYHVKKYGKIDGFNGEELYANASVSISGRGIFIGTVDGAYQYHEKDELIDLSPPSTYLTHVTFRGTKWIGPQAGLFQLPVNPELKHSENYVTFQFSSTSLSNPYNTQFSYTMDGLDEGWSIPGSSQIVSYSNLAPGRYTFKVQSVSENKVMGSVAEYTFVIQPAFWQTPLFYGLVLMSAGVAVVTAIQAGTMRRLRKLRFQEQLRVEESIRLKKQMSMDFHDEMGNRLANMLTQASLMKITYPEGRLNSVFDFFEKHAHAIYHGTKDFIWSIDFESNNLKEVIAYLRDFGADYFEKNNIKFHVEDEILSDAFRITLPDGYNRNIILIIKEAMTNTLKHARAHNIYFSANNQGGKYTIEVKDDGVGFSGSGRGNGLKNMQLRAARINGKVVVTGGLGGGTCVILSFNVYGHGRF
ncbi:MAG TPA: triple tyrosine motif-containing protein [Cyclobacteriaceae bacterium]|nr:hypothetical protein [Cyclobacteriaceae bacterium]HMV09914.1 triple tyrosine motif-containing protein [Cyclobacteriaceae bacterium]HMV88864.1 triple tyrosine motif-containing protein [Cyclobacteriaceae bacterium]HMW99652.1 triple tyrosine motif-containing protein [Cyclobacteriaceae bacterium]HMX50971.1 triple tyrosine motif-containing protein [Cyclobacteriaceae bacterium]